MDSFIANERQLQSEIETLREKFPQTQELYREVCILLFFRYGITPTANKLYQLVRKGSMTAPAEALTKFWDNLREKSRVRIEHPDLPEEIKSSAGELAATLWTLAQQKAAASLHAYEAEARASVMEARAQITEAEAQRVAAEADAARSRQSEERAREQISTLQQQLAAESATREMLETQLAKAQADIQSHQQANESARLYFAGEMEKLRTDAQLADERYRASEKRALLEIDRERTQAIKLQKELDAVRSEAVKAGERHWSEANALQQQLGDLRQQAGMLEGQLKVATAARDQLAQELKASQAQANESSNALTLLRSEMQSWKSRTEAAEKNVAELREKLARAKPARKAKAGSQEDIEPMA